MTKEIAEHIKRMCKHGGDARLSIENLVEPTWTTEPVNRPTTSNARKRQELICWEQKVNKFARRQQHFDGNIKYIYLLIVWGQCT
jgi:hypothetical protein